MSIAKWLLAKKLGGGSPFPPVIKRVTGNPIEFSDGADAPLVKCTTTIQGYQDLHGYDKPWVGGAGKNKYSGTDKTVNRETVITLANDLPSGIWWFSAIIDCNNPEDRLSVVLRDANNAVIGTIYIEHDSTTRTYGGVNVTAPIHSLIFRSGSTYATAQGYTATYTDIMLESGEYTSTYEPYENICPITAYNQSTISVEGKNNLPFQTEVKAQNGVTVTPLSNGRYNFTGRATTNTAIQYPVTINKIGVYRFIADNYTAISNGNITLYYRTIGGGTTQVLSAGSTIDLSVYEITYIAFFCGTNIDVNFSNVGLMLVDETETDKTFEPYVTPTTHIATFSQSIYQGNADFVGESAKCDMPVIDLGDINWQYNASGKTFYTTLSNCKSVSASDVANALSDSFACVSNNALSNDLALDSAFSIHRTGTNTNWLNVRWLQYDTASDFKTAVTGIKLTYELATPTTETITPTNLPIKSLFGYNHIESSTGDMVVDYITEGYQNFVDTVESALPSNTRNLLTASKGGTKAMDIFLSLEKRDDKEEEEVKEETKDDMR